MIIFTNSSIHLKRYFNQIDVIGYSLDKYPSGEYKIEFSEELNSTCNIISSVISHDDIIELISVADAAKNSGCKKVRAILPYLMYSRQDKYSKFINSGFNVILDMLRTRIDELYTLDLHSNMYSNINNISSIDVAISAISEVSHNGIIVAPDRGAATKAQNIAKKLNMEAIICDKQRLKDSSIVINMPDIKDKDKSYIIIDDIIDSGRTLYEVSKAMHNSGVSNIIAFCTHGIMNPGCLYNISYISKLYITNSIFHKHPLPDKIVTCNISNAIKDYLL